MGAIEFTRQRAMGGEVHHPILRQRPARSLSSLIFGLRGIGSETNVTRRQASDLLPQRTARRPSRAAASAPADARDREGRPRCDPPTPAGARTRPPLCCGLALRQACFARASLAHSAYRLPAVEQRIAKSDHAVSSPRWAWRRARRAFSEETAGSTVMACLRASHAVGPVVGSAVEASSQAPGRAAG